MTESSTTTSTALDASRRYLIALTAIVVAALAVRILYALQIGPESRIGMDSHLFYRSIAANLTSGDGFTTGTIYPNTGHPPMFVYLLAALDLVGLRSIQAQRIALAVLGSVGLVAVAEIGRRLRDPLTGLTAALIGAMSPLWFSHSHALMPESLVLILGPVLLLCALWCLEAPSNWRWALIGGLAGLAILTRSDLALLVVLLGAVLVYATRKQRTNKPQHIALMLGAVAVVVAPWAIFHRLETGGWGLSTNGGFAFAGANCDETYYSPGLLGSWSEPCGSDKVGVLLGDASMDVSEADTLLFRKAVHYARTHPRRLPVVALARIARTWTPYQSRQTDYLARNVEGRSPTWERRGLIVHSVIVIAAVGGVVVSLRDRRLTALVLLTPIISVTILSMLIYGSTKMRALAQPSVALFAGAMFSLAIHRIRKTSL